MKYNLKNVFFNRGFTLIELLVVISVFGVLSVVITSVLTQSLRGDSRVRVLNKVKQNAQVVLDQISKNVQSADAVFCTGSLDDTSNTLPTASTQYIKNNNGDKVGFDTLVLISRDSNNNQVYTRYRFYAPYNNGTRYSDNGFIAVDSSSTVQLSCDPTKVTNGTTKLGLQSFPNASNTGVPMAQILTDVDPINGVALANTPSGAFSASSNSNVFYDHVQAGTPDSVTISFRAFSGVLAQSLFENTVESGGVLFTTSATIRNNPSIN